MKKFKILLLFILFCSPSFAQYDPDYRPTSGVIWNYGEPDTCYWELDTVTCVLSITGNGILLNDARPHWGRLTEFVKHLIIGEGITEIEYGRFQSCDALKSVSLPTSLVKIGNYAFSFCKSLESITFPKNVNYIGKSGFSECSSLRKLTFLNPVPPELHHIHYPASDYTQAYDIGPFGLAIDLTKLIVEVPTEFINAYASAPFYPKFGVIGDFVTSVTLVKPESRVIVHPDSSYTLSGFVSPSTAAEQQIFWSSSDTSLAKVSSDGVVTSLAKKGSPVFIYAHTYEGNFKDSVEIIAGGNSAFLSSIDVENCSLEPAFSPDITEYTLKIPYAASNLDVTAIPEFSNSTVTVSDTFVRKINASPVVVTVTDSDSLNTNRYYLHIYRKSNDARLKNLTMSQGLLNPGFTKDRYEYTLILSNEAQYVDIDGTISHPNATFSGKVRVNRPVDTNVSLIELHVTAEDTAYTNTYIINAYWKSGDATLSSLEVEGYEVQYELQPEFSPNHYQYSIQIPHYPSDVVVKAKPKGLFASVRGTGYNYITSSQQTINITVVSEDGKTTKDYYITVTGDAHTGMKEIEYPETGKMKFYDLNGRLVTQPDKARGRLLIMSDGVSKEKILIK